MRRVRRAAVIAAVVLIAGAAGVPAAAAATPVPPFTQCPPIGADPSCALLVVVTDAGATVLGDSARGPYDGADDTVVGILNNSSRNVGSLPLSSSTASIFGFEGDGICASAFPDANGNAVSPPAGCPFGSTGYEGPNTTFGAISADTMSGTVSFTTPIPPGGSGYFSLEDTLLATDLTPGTPTTTPGGGATPTIATQASASVTVGSQVTDTATLGGGSAPTGTITFSVFGPADQTCKAAPVFTSPPVTVTGAGTYTSAPYTTAAAGTYHLVANYSGDAANSAAATGCADAGESVAVTKATPTIATQAGPAVPSGGSVTDTATLGGGFNPTGTITFKLYGPGDPTCARAPTATWTIHIAGRGSFTSAPVPLNGGGSFDWTATYSGDANNNAVATPCHDPKETVAVGASPGQACGDLGSQVDAQLPAQSIASDLSRGLAFNLDSPLSIGLRVVLRAKDPATGSFVSLANLLVHAAGAVSVQATDNGLGSGYARRAARFLAASEQAGRRLEVFRIVHCRPDKQTVSAESIGIVSLGP